MFISFEITISTKKFKGKLVVKDENILMLFFDNFPFCKAIYIIIQLQINLWSYNKGVTFFFKVAPYASMW